jgi:hypothetical protein
MIFNHETTEESFMSGKSEGVLIGHCILDAMPSGTKLVKTASSASSNSDALSAVIKAFTTVLETLAATSNVQNVNIPELAKTASLSSEVVSKDITIKIPSTSVKDSHYFIDISLDSIKKSDKSLVMVSLLLREGYLGRYMIKRCFYYLPSNLKEAESTYEELIRKSNHLKKRYLNNEAKIFDILPNVKSVLDGIHGDFEFNGEDSLGATVNRDREGYHSAEGPMQPHLASDDHMQPRRI